MTPNDQHDDIFPPSHHYTAARDTLPADLRPVHVLLQDYSASWRRQLPPADALNARLSLLLEDAPGERPEPLTSRTHPALSERHLGREASTDEHGTIVGLGAARSTRRAQRWFSLVAALLVIALGASVFGVFAAHRPGPGVTLERPTVTPAGTPTPTVPPITRVLAPQPQNTRLPVPADAYIGSVSFSSAGDGWVAGGINVPDYAGADFSVEKAELVHYHGGQWTAAQETFKYGGAGLVSMASANEGWAIGTFTSDPCYCTPTPPTLLHFAGGHWQRAGTLPYASFLTLHMLSADFGYATAFNSTGPDRPAGNDPSLILVFSHGTWTPIMSPMSMLSPTVMVSPEEGWSVGKNVPANGPLGIYHYLRGSWTDVLPVSGGSDFSNVIPYSLSMASPQDMWAAGTACKPLTPGEPMACRPIVYHFDGTSWSPVTPPDTSSVNWNHAVDAMQVFSAETGAAWFVLTTEDATLSPANAKRQYETLLFRHAHGQWQAEALPVAHPMLASFASDHNGGTWAAGWTKNPYASYVLYTQGDGTWRVYGHT